MKARMEREGGRRRVRKIPVLIGADRYPPSVNLLDFPFSFIQYNPLSANLPGLVTSWRKDV